MKKSLIYTVAIICLVSTYVPAQNSLSIEWRAGTGQAMLDHTSEPGSPVPLGIDSLYFLFYTPDTTIHLDPLNFDGNIATQRGNDQLVSFARDDFQLTSKFLNINNDWSGNAISSAGYFYTVVLDLQNASVDEMNSSTWDVAIPNGTLSYISNISPFIPFDDISPPSVVVSNAGGTWVGDGLDGSALVNVALVPEPGTLALIVLAAGGIAMKFRRRRS